jgi:hypothetical protein
VQNRVRVCVLVYVCLDTLLGLDVRRGFTSVAVRHREPIKRCQDWNQLFLDLDIDRHIYIDRRRYRLSVNIGTMPEQSEVGYIYLVCILHCVCSRSFPLCVGLNRE